MNTIIEKAPQEWKTVSFKELAKERSSRVDNPGESGYEIYVGLEHLDSGSLIVKRHGSTKDVTSSMKLFKKGDILFARRNTYLRRCSVATFDGVCSGDIIVLQPILTHIVEGFLPILMQFEPLENRIISLSAGAFSKRIKWRQLAEEKIPIPSKEEQQKIVEAVWSIQDNIQKTEKLIETTEKFKQGLLDELLTKGIGHIRFKDTELGRIPEEWEVVKFSDVVEIIGGGTPKTSVPQYWGGDIPWIAIDDIKPNLRYIAETNKTITEEGFKNSSTKLLEPNSLIISARGTVGLVAQVEKTMAFNQSCYGLNGNGKVVNDFLYYLLTAKVEKLRNTSYGSTFNSITKKNFDLFLIAVPNIDEQEKIVKILDSFEVSESEYKENIVRLNILKKKIIDEIISGNLKV